MLHWILGYLSAYICLLGLLSILWPLPLIIFFLSLMIANCMMKTNAIKPTTTPPISSSQNISLTFIM